MALVKCHECGNEISTEAKVCPQCGAKNKNRKKSKVFTFWGAFLILFGIFVIYIIVDHLFYSGIPTCESSRGRKIFAGVFDRSAWAKQNMIKVVDVIEQKTISVGDRPEDLVCEVTFRLSNSTNETYIFTFDTKKDFGYIINARPK